MALQSYNTAQENCVIVSEQLPNYSIKWIDIYILPFYSVEHLKHFLLQVSFTRIGVKHRSTTFQVADDLLYHPSHIRPLLCITQAHCRIIAQVVFQSNSNFFCFLRAKSFFVSHWGCWCLVYTLLRTSSTLKPYPVLLNVIPVSHLQQPGVVRVRGCHNC